MKTLCIKTRSCYKNFSVVRLQIKLKICIIYSFAILRLWIVFIYDDLSLILLFSPQNSSSYPCNLPKLEFN